MESKQISVAVVLPFAVDCSFLPFFSYSRRLTIAHSTLQVPGAFSLRSGEHEKAEERKRTRRRARKKREGESDAFFSSRKKWKKFSLPFDVENRRKSRKASISLSLFRRLSPFLSSDAHPPLCASRPPGVQRRQPGLLHGDRESKEEREQIEEGKRPPSLISLLSTPTSVSN